MTASAQYTPAPDRYDSIDYRRLGRSGLRLPGVSLGLWQNFGATGSGSRTSLEDQRDIILAAFDHGITHYDLANNYGPPPGEAERNFGAVIARDLAPFRDEIVIATKAGYHMHEGPYGEWGSRKHLLNSLDQSLIRMGIDYVDIYYHHRPDPDTPLAETMSALDHAVRTGKALYVGVSNYSPEQTQEAIRILTDLGTPLLVHQFSYSMYERSPEDGLIDVLDQNGVGATVFSPLAQGLLTDKYLDGVPQGSRATWGEYLSDKQITPTYLERTQALNEIAQERGQSLAQLAIQWVLRTPTVASALVGASSVAQLRDSLGALEFPELSEAEIARIDTFAVHGTHRV